MSDQPVPSPTSLETTQRLRLVLLPGMDGTGTLFAPFIAALGTAAEVIVGHYPTDEPLGYAALTPLAQQFLPQSGRYVLLGESFSGPLAITLAAAHPPGLVGLVLCCSFARPPRPLLSLLTPLCSFLPVASAPHWLLSRALLGAHADPALREALRAAVGVVSPRVLRSRLRAIMTVDVAAQLARVAVPVLYLRGAQDRIVPRSAARLVQRCAPQTQDVELAGPHLLLQATPVAAAAAVQELLTACAASQQTSPPR